jgi:hypothetical protein
MPHPVKPPALRVLPRLADAEPDGPVADRTRHRAPAIRLLGIVGPLCLAILMTAGYRYGLTPATEISELELGMIRVLEGFLALIIIAAWPSYGE